MKHIEAMYDMDVNELEEVMIVDRQMDEIALKHALNTVFCNAGEEDFPDDPMQFIAQCIQGEGMQDDCEMIPWEPFEFYSATDLLELVEDFEATFKRAINEALTIERG